MSQGSAKRHKQIRKMQAILERDGMCMDCGFDLVENPECGDFDHRPGEIKLFALSARCVTKAVFDAELAKCDLVCKNCHAIRTRERKNGFVRL